MTLERKDFQRLLFRTAFCIMACDGHIDDREIKEIKWMNKHASYFKGIDLTDELNELLSDLKIKGKHIFEELLNTISELDISTVQELLILEVALRLTNTDEKVHENEIKLVRFFRSKLRVHDEIIRDRFGLIDYLFDKDYSQDTMKGLTHEEVLKTVSIPGISELSAINFELPPTNS